MSNGEVPEVKRDYPEDRGNALPAIPQFESHDPLLLELQDEVSDLRKRMEVQEAEVAAIKKVNQGDSSMRRAFG